MQPEPQLRRAQRLFSVKRVYGEPVERDGVTVIPAAQIYGGGGGGGGTDSEGHDGGGLGFGVHARPVGAWVIGDGTAEWKPSGSAAVDRLASLVPVIAALALLILWLLRRSSA